MALRRYWPLRPRWIPNLYNTNSLCPAMYLLLFSIVVCFSYYVAVTYHAVFRISKQVWKIGYCFHQIDPGCSSKRTSDQSPISFNCDSWPGYRFWYLDLRTIVKSQHFLPGIFHLHNVHATARIPLCLANHSSRKRFPRVPNGTYAVQPHGYFRGNLEKVPIEFR